MVFFENRVSTKNQVNMRSLGWAVIQCVCVLSHVQLFVTPWTVAHQAPQSMEFSRQEYWSGLPLTSAGIFSNAEIKPTSFGSPALAGRFFTTEQPPIKRRNLDTERDTQMEPNVKTQGKEGHRQAKSVLGHQQPGERPGASHSLLSSGRQSLVLLTA